MKIAPKSVYLDVCALQRPYDDQSYMRIVIETTAVQLLVVRIKARKFKLYYSPVHVREINKHPTDLIRFDLIALLQEIGISTKSLVNPSALEKRGRELILAGFGAADAFHVAHAELIKASFITCDDRLLKKCRMLSVAVWYGTPLEFCEKEGIV